MGTRRSYPCREMDLGMPSKKGNASSGIIGLRIDVELYFDKLKVAEKFNLFDTTIVLNLAEKLPQSFNRLGKNFVESFYRNKGVLPNSYSLKQSFKVTNVNVIKASIHA